MAPNIVQEIFMTNGDYYSVVITDDYDMLNKLSSAIYKKFCNGEIQEEVKPMTAEERFKI